MAQSLSSSTKSSSSVSSTESLQAAPFTRSMSDRQIVSPAAIHPPHVSLQHPRSIALASSPSRLSPLHAYNNAPPSPFPLAAPPRPSTASPSPSLKQRRTIQDFEFSDITIGEGSYSTVYKAFNRCSPSARAYAVKVLDQRHIVKEGKTKYVNTERDALIRLDRHPGIVRLYYTFRDNINLYFVIELAEQGDILDHLKNYGSFSEPVARFYAAQILSAVEHMHNRDVIHRDLKPENILFDGDMRIKITDFGSAKILKEDGKIEDKSNSFVGTAEYVSPELLNDKTVSKASDLWAFGCIIFQLLAGKPPFKGASEYLTMQKVIKLDYEFIEGFPESAKDLIQKLLVLDPSSRIGIEDIKSHDFFKDIDWGESLWTCKPPALKTGLVKPIPRTTQHPMFEDIVWDRSHQQEEEDDEEGEEADEAENGEEEEEEVTETVPKSDNFISKANNAQETSNNSFLYPDELIRYSGLVKRIWSTTTTTADKRENGKESMIVDDHEKTLALTTRGRLLCLVERTCPTTATSSTANNNTNAGAGATITTSPSVEVELMLSRRKSTGMSEQTLKGGSRSNSGSSCGSVGKSNPLLLGKGSHSSNNSIRKRISDLLSMKKNNSNRENESNVSSSSLLSSSSSSLSLGFEVELEGESVLHVKTCDDKMDYRFMVISGTASKWVEVLERERAKEKEKEMEGGER